MKNEQIWHKFNNYVIYSLAVSVNLGAALVSISKSLLLVSLVFYLFLGKLWKTHVEWSKTPYVIWTILLSMLWLSITYCWTDVQAGVYWASINRHARLVLILLVFGLIGSRESIYKTMQFLIIGHLFVLFLSYLMWLGVLIPFTQTKLPYEYAVPFTSSLEQPVMSALVVVLIWYFKDKWFQIYGKVPVYIAAVLCIFNVFFIMMGRTGFLVMLLALTFIVFFELPKKFKWVALILPIILGCVLFTLSPRLQSRTLEIYSGVKEYQSGNVEKSESLRLDYWHRSFLSIKEHPIVGSGVGSWRDKYQEYGGKESNPPTNPHNQFLLWWVEAGGIGLILLITLLVAFYRDANRLEQQESRALICITSLAIVMSLFNCPFYGVGMGEFFMLLFGCLLATGKYAGANKTMLRVQVS
jgi:O-antigen ligase